MYVSIKPCHFVSCLFSIKHSSSSLSFILLLRIFWLQKTFCISLVSCGNSCFPKCTVPFRKQCQELTFVSSFYVPWMAALWCKMKCFWPEATLPMKLLVPFVSISERSPCFEKQKPLIILAIKRSCPTIAFCRNTLGIAESLSLEMSE